MSAIEVEPDRVGDPGISRDSVVLTVGVDPSDVRRKKEEVTAARFREALLQAVQTLVSRGARIESQSGYSAIVLKKRWIGGNKRLLVSLDTSGYAHVHKI